MPASFRESRQAKASPPAEAVRDQVRRMAASDTFARSDRLVKFLQFVTEEALQGRAEQLKEPVLAIEVFGRDPSYDSKTDSVVRVTAGKLRFKLKEYYSSEGAADPIFIEVPKGSYSPVFSSRVQANQVHTSTISGRVVIAACLAGILALGLMTVGWRVSRRPGMGVNALSSVAVLPFLNLSPEQNEDYFSDGLTEELIDALTRVDGMRVVARTSAFQFKGKPQDIRDIGKRLNVGTILEGSVRKSGNRLRITAQLNRASDGYHLWSQTYNREVKDVLEIQQEVSRAIVSTVQASGSNGPIAPWARRSATSQEVYELYLKGRHFYSQITNNGYELAIPYFERAIAKDSTYAPSYSGLADCYFLQGAQIGIVPPEKTVLQVKSLLAKALELDDSLSEAHVTLGRLKADYEWDWAAAEREFQRAIELNPGAARPHRRYGTFLSRLGRKDESIRELETAADWTRCPAKSASS